MASQFDSGSDEPIASINVTPFVDIILVVLIIFMVTAPILPRINVELPKASSGEESIPGNLNISVSSDGLILLNGQNVGKESVGSHAADLLKKNPDLQAVIAADKSVPHGDVIEIIDSIKGVGVKKFAISVENK